MNIVIVIVGFLIAVLVPTMWLPETRTPVNERTSLKLLKSE